MSAELPDVGPSTDVRELLLTYLDFYRAAVTDKLSGLSDADLRTSRLPSGWTPIELLKHLVFMERRWLVWGVRGDQVDEPWGDDRNGRWSVPPEETVEEWLAALHQGGRRTREIVAGLPLTAIAARTGRFADRSTPPSVTAVLFHVLQEYARHAGHLDIARELIDGSTGE
ncbi:DinB family protein [Paractinoplanes rishiriensis]|nr:DinB family protein [Actinoplanes rishiriensis]